MSQQSNEQSVPVFGLSDGIGQTSSQHNELGPDLVRQETENYERSKRFLFDGRKDTKILVDFDQNDPLDPHNWHTAKKSILSIVAALIVLNATFSSSAPSGITRDISEYFSVGHEVNALTVSIFVAGYSVGPILWGPFSEFVGRKPVFILSMILYTAWNVGCALSRNIGSLLVFRFLAGACAAASLSNSGGLIADLFIAKTRGVAMCVYAVAPFAGPALGPIVGGFIQSSGANWRWLFWTLALYSGFCTFVVFFIPETYAPKLLRNKAKRLRNTTGDPRYVTKAELVPFTAAFFFRNILAKPFILVAREPMLQAAILYQSYLFGLLYLLFEAYPIVFQEGHGFNSGIGGLMFLPFTIGGLLAVVVYIAFLFPRYAKLCKMSPSGKAQPEARLPMAMIGAPLIVIGFFWFGWTSNPRISFWVPLISTTFFGFSFLFVFGGLFNFIVDTYTTNAASALAASAIFRSSLGATFPLFARQMFQKLGTPWACSLIAFLALLMVPIPYVLFRYGPRLRQMSKDAI